MFIGIAATIPDLPNLPGQGVGGPEVTLDYSSSNFCADASDPTLSDASPVGGVFSYTGVGTLDLNTSTGTIDISGSDPGNYTVIYTVIGVGNSSFPINITAVQDSSFSYSASAFCKNASNQTPTITTPGGSFTTQDITWRPFTVRFVAGTAVPGVSDFTFKTGVIKTGGTSYRLNWGDGTIQPTANGAQTHTFTAGTYDIEINSQTDTGPITWIRFDDEAAEKSAQKVNAIVRWGGTTWFRLQNLLRGNQGGGVVSADVIATDVPDLSSADYITGVFENNTGLVNANGSIANWNLGTVTDARFVFKGCTNFNMNLSSWILPSVSNAGMTQIFLNSGMTSINYTDTIVGWAVQVYNNSNSPTVNCSGNNITFDGTRTSDAAAGQAYSVKYSNWPSAWTNNNAQDAFDYLVNTANWSL
jgi:hypothetical protein